MKLIIKYILRTNPLVYVLLYHYMHIIGHHTITYNWYNQKELYSGALMATIRT